MTQAFPEEAAAMTEADVVTGSTDRASLPLHIQKALETGERVIAITPHRQEEVFEELPIDRFEGHTRAFVKVEDGCNRRCAYCVIPRARGSARSRPVESTLRELEALAKRLNEKKESLPKTPRKNQYFEEAQLAVGEYLNRRVKVAGSKKKGTLQIEFYGEEDLQNLLHDLHLR